MTEQTATSDRVQLNNKIHTSPRKGEVGSCRDDRGRFTETSCRSYSAKTRPSYVAADTKVTCKRCLAA